jgi:MFS family permease
MAGLSTFTLIHTLLSLVALVAGIAVAKELLASRLSAPVVAVFLFTAVATSATGFGFDAKFQASHVLGIMSLVVLLAAILGLYVFHLAGAWRWLFAVGVLLALYFDVFVAIVQAFKKIPAVNALAPTQSEPPFAIAQAIALLVFAWLIYAAVRKFRPMATAGAH